MFINIAAHGIRPDGDPVANRELLQALIDLALKSSKGGHTTLYSPYRRPIPIANPLYLDGVGTTFGMHFSVSLVAAPSPHNAPPDPTDDAPPWTADRPLDGL